MNEIEQILAEDAACHTSANDAPTTPRKKKKWRIVVCVLALIVLLFFFVPRILLWNYVKKLVPDVGGRAEYFTAYDIVDESYVPVETEYIKLSIPPTMIYKKENNSDSTVYWDETNPDVSISLFHTDTEDFEILDRSVFSSMSDDTYDMLEPVLEDVLGSLGYGLPDSTYNTLKCLHLLDESDRSFWSLKKLCAFAVYGLLDKEMFVIGTPYIYESEKTCGILQIKEDENGAFCYASLFHPEHLNESYIVIIRLQTTEALSLVLNSIQIK